jgi:fatty-acyl-CoA synthase
MLNIAHLPAETHPVVPSTVGGILREAAERDGAAPALVESRAGGRPRRWSYRQLLAEAEAAARALLRRFAPGDPVAVWAPNSAEWLVLQFGVALAGMVLVPVNPAFRAAEARHVLAASRAVGLFGAHALVAEHRGRSGAEGIRAGLPALREVIDLADWTAFVGETGDPPPLPTVPPEAVAQIRFTAGTTGTPKGVLLTHAGVTGNARLAVDRLGFDPGSAVVHALSLADSGAALVLALGPVQQGWTHVLVDTPDPARMLKLIESERAEALFGDPDTFTALLEHRDFPKRDMTSLRVLCARGELVDAGLVARVEKFFDAEYVAVYGQTEASGVVSATAYGDPVELKATGVGRPLPNTEVKLIEPGGAETVAIGEVGELLVRGHGVMAGYLGSPGRARSSDGWLRTGDLCTMDAEGNLRVVGRVEEMIVRGGQHILPTEIEQVLSAHPAVVEAAVLGWPDEHWGEQVAAFVRLQPGTDVDAEDLAAFTRERLPSAGCPRLWRTVDRLPRTASGSVQKFRLRHV